MDLATADYLLTTTRSVRKRLDLTRPVEPEIIERCIEIAIQAPTGSNSQGWQFMVVTDPDKRAGIATLYKKSFDLYNSPQGGRRPTAGMDRTRLEQAVRVRSSAVYLSEHMHQVPVLIIPCITGRVEEAGVMAQAGLYGSILPATWSLMLALRARGLGSAWTTLHLRYEREAAALLEIPETVTQTALLPVAYLLGGELRAARRLPARELTHWNQWGKRRETANDSETEGAT